MLLTSLHRLVCFLLAAQMHQERARVAHIHSHLQYKQPRAFMQQSYNVRWHMCMRSFLSYQPTSDQVSLRSDEIDTVRCQNKKPSASLA